MGAKPYCKSKYEPSTILCKYIIPFPQIKNLIIQINSLFLVYQIKIVKNAISIFVKRDLTAETTQKKNNNIKIIAKNPQNK